MWALAYVRPITRPLRACCVESGGEGGACELGGGGRWASRKASPGRLKEITAIMAARKRRPCAGRRKVAAGTLSMAQLARLGKLIPSDSCVAEFGRPVGFSVKCYPLWDYSFSTN